MSAPLKLVALSILILLAAGIGFYVGLRRGADVMSTLASENVVASALRRMDMSLKGLDADDLTHSQEQHLKQLRVAVSDLASYAPFVPYWRCKDADTAVVGELRDYISDHPDRVGLPSNVQLDAAFGFCRDR